MRYPFMMTVLFCALALPVVLTGPAEARRHAGYCDDAKNTSETLNCLNRHHEDIQNELNEIYTALTEDLTIESREALQKAQTSWISYRDQYCQWEANRAEVPALERLYEISCLTAISEDRIEILKSQIQDQGENRPSEFGERPRWMNVIADEKPEVYWRYGRWIEADLNCDGAKEQITAGILPGDHMTRAEDPGQYEDESEDKTAETTTVVLAVADNPVTGKPRTSFFQIPLNGMKGGGDAAEESEAEEHTGPYLCHHDIQFAMTSHPQMPGTEGEKNEDVDVDGDENENQTCNTALQITDRQCRPLVLYAAEDEYQIRPFASVPRLQSE